MPYFCHENIPLALSSQNQPCCGMLLAYVGNVTVDHPMVMQVRKTVGYFFHLLVG
jgi:hypothetical protein